ncbi:GNAT family N-acetyltransferase [Candidatus Bipolaricaulota bacterium]|nr:GNAT family N-acetyltransferase [Candidatus Bipolaricaulota bacterium]
MFAKKEGPAYRVETDRLVIRCWEPRDAKLSKEAIDTSREHLRAWMPWADAEPDPLGVVINRLRHFRAMFDLDKDYVYAIFNKDETQVLGGSGLHTRLGENAREIGYWIHVDHIDRGYATEVSAALTRVAFEIDGMDRVEIHCSPLNLASVSVPRKIGFVHEATLRRRGPIKDGQPVDSMIWSMHAADYPGSMPASAKIMAYDACGERVL